MVCFNCDEEGHISTQCKKPKKAQTSGKVFALTGTQTENEDRLIRGTCFFNSTPLIAIIDIGATCNALVVFIYFIKYRVYLIELFYLCDLLMFI